MPESRLDRARKLLADRKLDAIVISNANSRRYLTGYTAEDHPPDESAGVAVITVDRAALHALLAAHPMRLHGWLRDQHVIAGVGRRLANEICHRGHLSPFAGTAKLDGDQVTGLHVAIGEVIAESLAEERSRDDIGPSRERSSAVHDRAGEPCPSCGDQIRSVTYRAYTVFYCPTCQTQGKVLADNTTSKFLK